VTHSCQFKNFGREVLENCGDIDCCLGSYAHLVLGVVLEETLDTAARELKIKSLASELSSFVRNSDRIPKCIRYH